MKTLKLFGGVLTTVLLSVNLASCSSEEEILPEVPQSAEKYVTVGLGCGGEILNISDSPLSRATGDDLYGIQVYSLEETDTEDGTAYSESYYAYGFFTSLDDVTIKLLEEQKYRFKVSVVIDAFKNGDTDWFGVPYYNYCNNIGEFIYSASDYLHLSLRERRSKIMHDRFYGELDEYTPAENGNVTIDTKRVVYGAKYIAENLTEGSLTIQVTNTNEEELYTVTLTPSAPQDENIYTFEYIYYAWKGNYISTGTYDDTTGKLIYEYTNYTSDGNLTINWTKADGSVTPLGTYTVTFKRNVMTTIRIKAEELTTSNGIVITKEEVAMSDDDNEYYITGGQVIEVPVTSGN